MNHANIGQAASRLSALNDHIQPNITAAAPAKKAPKGNFKDCMALLNQNMSGWSYLGMNEYMGEKAIGMKAQIEQFLVENEGKV